MISQVSGSSSSNNFYFIQDYFPFSKHMKNLNKSPREINKCKVQIVTNTFNSILSKYWIQPKNCTKLDMCNWSFQNIEYPQNFNNFLRFYLDSFSLKKIFYFILHLSAVCSYGSITLDSWGQVKLYASASNSEIG